MSVYRDKRNGRWRFRKRLELTDGRKVRLGATPPINTRAAAESAERAAIERALRGDMNPTTKEVPTVKEYAEKFMATYKPGQKPSERRAKERILESHLLPVFGEMRLDQIRQEHVGAFIAEQQGRGRAAKTINNRLAVLSSLLKFAVTNQVIAKPSLRFKVDAMDSELTAVAFEDVEQLLAVATPLYRAAVLLGAEAGLRAGEMRGLQWTDVKDGLLHVRRALDTETGEVIAPKHNKQRVIPVSPRLAVALSELPRRGLWVLAAEDGRPLAHDRGLYRPMVALYEAAGVTRPPKVVHCLRHTFGTQMAARGTPLPVLQELMGHASIETTRRYIHVNEEQKRVAIARVFGQPAANGQTKSQLSLQT